MRRLLLLVALATCTSSRADPPAQRFEHDMMARFHMHESYTLFAAIERLLVRGKLAEARDLARGIGAAPDEAGLGAWANQAAAVRDRAAAIARATTVADACRHTARLARACATCHADAGVTAEFHEPPPVPPDRPTLEARMARHLWAVERLREGMVGGDVAPWRAGLDLLARAPLPTDEPARRAFGKRLHDLADAARRPPLTPDDQTRAYGDLLATCAACHAAAPPP